jgi:hypothetical protein
MFLDESWRHSNGFGIIAADGHLGFDSKFMIACEAGGCET